MYREDLTTTDCEAIIDLADAAFNNLEEITDPCSAFGGVLVSYQERIYLVGDDHVIIALPVFIRYLADGVAFVKHNDQRYAEGLLDGRREAKRELHFWLEED